MERWNATLLTPIGLMLILTLLSLLAGRALIVAWRRRGMRAVAAAGGGLDAALIRAPDLTALGPATLAAALGSGAIALPVGWSGAWGVGMVLAPLVPPLVMLLVVRWQQRRAVHALDAALPGAVGRLAALMRTGVGLPSALDQVVERLPPDHPLADEWRWWLERLGAPLGSGGRATPTLICAALRRQTPSARHALFLMHLEPVLDQPHALLVRTVDVAWRAMHAEERRRSMVAAELAYVRNTGLALFLINGAIGVYLALVQWERVVAAYAHPTGMVVGALVALGALTPLIGASLLGAAAATDGWW